MKISQVLAAVVTLVVALGIVSSVVRRTPSVADQASTAVTEPRSQPDGEDPAEGEDREHFRENPFTPAPRESAPRAAVPEDLYDFERMALGHEGRYEFVIRNVGEGALKLARGPAQCKCTVAGLKDQEIPPGGEARINLEYKPEALGPFHQSAVIWTNDPEMPRIELTVEGEVMAEVMTEPESNWVLGTIQAGEASTFEGGIYSSVIEEFEITQVETSSDHVTVDVQPMTDQEKRFGNALSGYRLSGRIEAPEKAGAVKETVLVRTNLEQYPVFEFTVTGNVTGPILIVGPNWYGGNHLMRLGVIDARKGSSNKLTFMVQPFDGQLEFTDVQASPGFVQVSLKPEQSPPNAKRERYSFVLEIPPGSPRGVWQIQNPAEVRIKTNHPLQDELLFKVEMEVR